MLTTIHYVLLTALRDRLFAGLMLALIAAAFISATLGSTAFLEEQEMAITFAGGASRLILAIGLIVFVCFHIRSAFDSREIDVMLSRPVSRLSLVVAYWLGFAAIATLLLLPALAILFLVGAGSGQGFVFWGISLWLEMLFVVALALFAALALRSAVTAVLASLGFYVLSRMMAFFVMTSQSGFVDGSKYSFFKYLLWIISTCLPRLDFFAKSEWLSYGLSSARDWQLFLAQAVIFIPLLLLASMADFKRRQF